MFVTEEELKNSVSISMLAVGNGLHADLDENGVISLVLWAVDCENDTTIFEAKLTPEQEHLLRNADKVDNWTIDPVVYEQCVQNVALENQLPAIVQLHPIASNDVFDVRLSADGSLLVYREDTSACIVDVKLTSEQVAQIAEVSKQAIR